VSEPDAEGLAVLVVDGKDGEDMSADLWIEFLRAVVRFHGGVPVHARLLPISQRFLSTGRNRAEPRLMMIENKKRGDKRWASSTWVENHQDIEAGEENAEITGNAMVAVK
jgi:hypothetical protein